MKIGLLTCELAATHGWAHYGLSLTRALCAAGVEPVVLAARSSPPLDHVPVYPMLPDVTPREPRFLFKLLRASGEARRLLANCDVIHAAIEPYAPLAAMIAGNRPLLVTAHGSYVRLANQRRWPVSGIYARALRRSTLVCVSRYTARVVADVLPGARTVVVNNGVDAARLAGITRVENDRPTVLAVGAVKPRKGILELVQAIDTVRGQIPAVQCVIIGSLTQEPAYVRRVQAAIRDLMLEEHVHLLGHVPENVLLDWYSRADLFALPAMNDGWKFEGYGLAHLEASAAGLPVIGTTDCGTEDAVDDGLTGLLVRQSAVRDQLAAAIIRLLRDPALAAQMGAAGRKKAARQTWDHVATQMIEVYRQAISGIRR